MKKGILFLLVMLMVVLLFPLNAFAASAQFVISGPDTLQTGQTGTYTVKVKVEDASAAQATLEYDSSFFQLVSGNVTGEWDSSGNTSGTMELTTVTLKCIGAVGTSGSLSLSGKQASRFTGGDPPSESVSCGGGSKTVSNPVPESATAAPTAAPAATPRRTASATPAPAATPTATPTLTPTPSPTPTATPDAWAAVKEKISAATAGSTVDAESADGMLPSDILALLKQKGCILALNLGNGVCTIDGRNIGSVPEGPLDLRLNLGKDETMSAAADGADLFQLDFGFGGELPGRVGYTMKADGCTAGETLYLYCYYPQAGAVEAIQQATVDADGNVSWQICHGQKYFVTRSLIGAAAQAAIANETAAQASSEQETAGISTGLLIGCTVGAALVGAMACWLVGWLLKRKKHV